MEAIEVTARWDKSGRVTPLRFIHGGVPVQVEAAGRQWTDSAGLHVMVQAEGGRAFELVFDTQALHWYLGFEGTTRPVV